MANKIHEFKDDILIAVWGYLELALNKVKESNGSLSFLLTDRIQLDMVSLVRKYL
jgi:hypothetical protein